MIKTFSFLILLTFISINSYSQLDSEKKGKENFKPSFDDGEVSGYIFDSQSKTPLEAVAVQLIRLRDSALYKGTETDALGFFKIQDIEQGRYSLSVFLTGYNKNIRTVLFVKPEEKILSLDTIFLKSGTETEEIVVETDKPFLELKGEKKIFNVAENMNVTGGTALDVLRNLPSVTVDIDNGVSLRGGQQIKFFINGRPVTGSISRILEQLPADQLSAVEVITNPSAKYDAESSTGVINLVMKKYDDTGFNGQLNLSSGTGDKYGGGLNLNYKTEKYNFTGSYDYRKRNMNISTMLTRNNFLFPESAFTNQNSNGEFDMTGNNFRGEIEYKLSQSDILNLSGKYDEGKRDRGTTEDLLIYNQDNILTQNSQTIIKNINKDNGYSLGLNYNKYFKNPKELLSGEVSYSYDKDYDNEDLQTDYTFPEGTPPLISQTQGSDLTDEVNAQADYTLPLNKISKIESGIKYNYRNTDASNLYYNQNDKTGGFELDSSLTDIFKFKENIAAAYMIYGNEGNGKSNFTFNIGLRGEYWNYNIDQTFENTVTSRNKFDLFPSITLSQKTRTYRRYFIFIFKESSQTRIQRAFTGSKSFKSRILQAGKSGFEFGIYKFI